LILLVPTAGFELAT